MDFERLLERIARRLLKRPRLRRGAYIMSDEWLRRQIRKSK